MFVGGPFRLMLTTGFRPARSTIPEKQATEFIGSMLIRSFTLPKILAFPVRRGLPDPAPARACTAREGLIGVCPTSPLVASGASASNVDAAAAVAAESFLRCDNVAITVVNSGNASRKGGGWSARPRGLLLEPPSSCPSRFTHSRPNP